MSARRGIIRRIVVALSALLVVALVAGIALAAWVARRPLPATAGTVTIEALDAPVTVTRDSLGVPHLWAESDRDLFLAQGYVHAQDRFFEMDYRRHVAAGRLSELVGDVEAARTADAVPASRISSPRCWSLAQIRNWAFEAPAFVKCRSRSRTASSFWSRTRYASTAWRIDLRFWTPRYGHRAAALSSFRGCRTTPLTA